MRLQHFIKDTAAITLICGAGHRPNDKQLLSIRAAPIRPSRAPRVVTAALPATMPIPPFKNTIPPLFKNDPAPNASTKGATTMAKMKIAGFQRPMPKEVCGWPMKPRMFVTSAVCTTKN